MATTEPTNPTGHVVATLRWGWNLFLALVGLASLGGAVACIVAASQSTQPGSGLWVLGSVVLLGCGVFGLLCVLRPERIELFPDGEIVYKNVFGTKKLHTHQLNGFRIRQGNLHAWGDLSRRPQLFASWLALDRREQVYEWFQQRVENLALREVNQEIDLLKQAFSEATEGELHELLRWNARLGRSAGILFVLLFFLFRHNPWQRTLPGALSPHEILTFAPLSLDPCCYPLRLH